MRKIFFTTFLVFACASISRAQSGEVINIDARAENPKIYKEAVRKVLDNDPDADITDYMVVYFGGARKARYKMGYFWEVYRSIENNSEVMDYSKMYREYRKMAEKYPASILLLKITEMIARKAQLPTDEYIDIIARLAAFYACIAHVGDGRTRQTAYPVAFAGDDIFFMMEYLEIDTRAAQVQYPLKQKSRCYRVTSSPFYPHNDIHFDILSH